MNKFKTCPNGHYYPENLNSCPYCHSIEDKTRPFPPETEGEEPWCPPCDYIIIHGHYYMLNSDKETASLLCWSKDAWDIYHEYLEFYDMYIESTLDEADYYKSKYEYYNQIRVKCIEEICKIPNKITYNEKVYPIVRIRSGAFAFCELNSLLMPDTITHIEKKAFFRCDGLKTLFIPSSVKNLAMGAISECKNLETITYDGTTYEDDIDELFIFPDQKNKYAIIDLQDLNNQTAIRCNNCRNFTPIRRRICIYCGSNIHEPVVQSAEIARPEYTPEHILQLAPNEIFVFGSNLEGRHGGGAARYAYENFGAEWGVGYGMTGHCYAIPTMHGGVKEIKPYVDEFIDFAERYQDFRFLVTPIGCGIAGFTPTQIAPLFFKAIHVPNIILPREFYDVLLPMEENVVARIIE